MDPTEIPTIDPTAVPTSVPTEDPTSYPTDDPTDNPTPYPVYNKVSKPMSVKRKGTPRLSKEDGDFPTYPRFRHDRHIEVDPNRVWFQRYVDYLFRDIYGKNTLV